MSDAPFPSSRVVVLFACLLQIVLGTVLAWTNLPLCDEGFYGVPSQMLSTTGSLRNPVLESAGINSLKGVDQHVYWMAPVAMIFQAAAFKVFGFRLLVQRELSVLCGSGAILLWYLALRKLIPERAAALAALLLSADFVFQVLSSLGRADMISFFFAMAAVAGYLHWRERSLTTALVVAHSACALSGMVHPNGGIAALISVMVLTVYLDGRRLRWSQLLYVAGCYVVLGLGWGLYIAEAPDLFVAQFLGNVSGRFGGPMTFAGLIKAEVGRYLAAYGLQDAHGIKLVRYLLPFSYLGAGLFCLFSKDLRRRSGVLLLIFLGISLDLIFLEGSKQSWYLLPLCPLYCAFLALAMNHLWGSGRLAARAIAVAQAGVVLLGMASLAYSASGRNYQRLFQPTAGFLNAHMGLNAMVFARSEFYFGLDCRACLRDDPDLGALSGRVADYIVLDPEYNGGLEDLEKTRPDLYRQIEANLGDHYSEVFRNPRYQVLQRTK